MDSGEEEEVSARVLLRNVLGSEVIRSPVTRSVSQTQADAHRRRSSRVRNLPPAESPQVVLRHKLKQKLHQSSAQSPAPPSKRRRSQGRAAKTPAVTSSSLYDEDITPRGLLRGIIRTEAEASLLLSGQPALPDTNQQLLETSVYSSRPSEGASGLDLPDLVTEPLSNVIRGMSRRRPPPTFNVSAFERQLEQQSGERAEDTEQNTEVTEEQDLSAGSKSVLSLTLKTPFVNIQSERAGLRRKAANRRQPSVEAFDEAVQKRLDRHCNQEYTVVQDGRTLGDSDWQKFTLGLSNVTVPDLTTDIVMCNTELYPQPPAATSPLEEHHGGGAPELHRHQGDQGLEAAEKIHEDEGGTRLEEGRAEDHQEDQVVEETHNNEIVEDQEEEEVEDHQRHSVNKTYETEPPPSGDVEDPGAGSQLHLLLELNEEEEEVQEEDEDEMEEQEMVSSPQEEESGVLSPDDIPFAPTQAMAEPLPQGREGRESGMQEVQEIEEIEEVGWRDSVKEDLQTMELPSQLLERITRRAYRSEGGAVIPGVTARGRVTKSLGAGLHPAERDAQSRMNGSGPGELPSPASPSVSSTLRPSPSVTRQTRGEEDISSAEQENIVSSSVHQSINSLSPAAEEEEEEKEEIQQEEEEEQEEAEHEQEQATEELQPTKASCPEESPLLSGVVKLSFESSLTLAQVAEQNGAVVKGQYEPADCTARQSVAILIPHRNREKHLLYLLHHLHPFLQRQQLHYAIYVIHQVGEAKFNRAKLLNVGYLEALKDYNWDCFIFHDVDLVPENDRNLYRCEDQPKHLVVGRNSTGYRLRYKGYFGGVTAMTREQFFKVNGFPNTYWGWGGEDDDLRIRVQLQGMKIFRPPAKIARYTMVFHKRDSGNEVNKDRMRLLGRTTKMWKKDGLNSCAYETLTVERPPLYINVTVDIGKPLSAH